jgi:hypothetical protein
VGAREDALLRWDWEVPGRVGRKPACVLDGHAPSVWLNDVENLRRARLPREHAAPIWPDDGQGFWLAPLEPSCPSDRFRERGVTDLLDGDRYAGENVLELVSRRQTQPVDDSSRDAVESAMHDGMVKTRHQQFRMSSTMT